MPQTHDAIMDRIIPITKYNEKYYASAYAQWNSHNEKPNTTDNDIKVTKL